MDEESVAAFRREVYLISPRFEFFLLKCQTYHHLSCDPVLEVCRDGLTAVNTWLGGVRHARFTYLLGIRRKERDELRAETVKQMKELRDKISGVLESFRSDKRFGFLTHYSLPVITINLY